MIPTAGPSLGPLYSPSLRDRDHAEARARRNPLVWLREILTIIVVALVTSSLLRAFIVQVSQIPSPSMHSTLVENNRIAISCTDALRSNVHRGDIVVSGNTFGWLGSSQATSPSMLYRLGEFTGFVPGDGEQILVKRVIGVGGDRASCTSVNGKVNASGAKLDETCVPDGQVPYGERVFDVVVPEGHLWMMSDDRSNSVDSRCHTGSGQSPYVPVSPVVGTAQAVVWLASRQTTDTVHHEVLASVLDAS